MIYDKESVFELWGEMLSEPENPDPSTMEMIYKALEVFHHNLDDKSDVFNEVREEMRALYFEFRDCQG
jgi:hypothetical protein